MKTLFQSIVLFSTLLISSFSNIITAQGLIVNEGGNGQGGNKDFFEFLVVGSAAQPTGTVDLTGWIIDDNNGEFGGGGSGKGIATGHIRMRSSCFSNIPIGAIIVIYNAGDKETLMPANDPTDANGDMVYIFPNTSTCFERCTAYPTTGSTQYNSSSCSYSASFTANQWSSTLGLSGDQDAFQIRKPDGSFYHGIGYGFSGSAANIVPTLPSELGGGTAVNIAGGASRYSLNFNCGALNDPASYTKDTATMNTPGAPNNADNAMLIENIRSGNFDYTNWANPANCETPILPLELLSFEAKPYSLLQNILTWDLAKVDPYSWVHIERSVDGVNFETIATLSLEATMEWRQYSHIDNTPYYTTYYRLRFEEINRLDSYSAVQVVNHQKNMAASTTMSVYPNPTFNLLNIALADAPQEDLNYTLVDALGRVVMQGIFPAQTTLQQISTFELPSGTYILRLDNNLSLYMMQKFIKI